MHKSVFHVLAAWHSIYTSHLKPALKGEMSPQYGVRYFCMVYYGLLRVSISDGSANRSRAHAFTQLDEAP